MQLLDGIYVRESKRARRMSLVADAPDRIEIVVPCGTSQARICAFAARHAGWIQRARRELACSYRGDTSAVPKAIVFPAVGARWRVQVEDGEVRLEGDSIASSCQTFPLRQVGQSGRSTTSESVRLHAWLRQWLMEQGRRLLPPRVALESQRLDLHPARVEVRLQRTRWGSCSARRTISLNARALFLEADVLRYLVVHELCHLAHMSHSGAYWQRVERHEPEYRRLDMALANAWAQVPLWAYSPWR